MHDLLSEYDHLGSVRLITDQNANVVSRHDYLPFGEEIPNGSGGRSGNGFDAFSNVNQKFTGQERDGELVPNADFFNARYFMGVLGNFTSPDPANAGADLYNPQSWNAYAYVLGNPLGLVDPSGMDACFTNYYTTNGPDGPTGPPVFGSNTTCYPTVPQGQNPQPPGYGPPIGPGPGGGGGGGSQQQPSNPQQPPKNWTNNTCVAGYGAAGAAAGAGVGWLGGGAAAILGAETGPADIAIAYGSKVLSSAVGTYVGQQTGQLIGSIVCSSRSGNGGDYRDKTRGANANDKQQIRNVARQAGIDPRRFGDFVEEEKEALGRGPSDNFSYGELVQLANDYKVAGGK